MKRGCVNLKIYMGLTRFRLIQILALIGFLYMIFMTYELPFVFMSVSRYNSLVSLENDAFLRHLQLNSKENLQEKQLFLLSSVPHGLIFDWRALLSTENNVFSGLNKTAITAFQIGEKFWDDLISGKMKQDVEKEAENRNETSCPTSISMSRARFLEKGKVMELPCGLTVGSYINVVGKTSIRNDSVVKSQFMIELIGLKSVDDEDPPRIFHYNPRLKGDWSWKPVIEQNACYRQQWGTSIRCEGWKSKPDEETSECFFHHHFKYFSFYSSLSLTSAIV